MEIQPKRSRFKKITEKYKTDNVLDIIDIADTLSKNRSIPKVPLDKFIYEKNIKDPRAMTYQRADSIKVSQILKNKNNKDINFDKLNNNKFHINFSNLKLQFPNGYSIAFIEAYYPIEIIGQGSFGVVISAIDLENNEKLAVKIVDKTENNIYDLKFLNNEVNILKKLSNPRILNVYEVLDTPKYFFIFMELIEGGSLKDLIIRRYNNKKQDYLFKDSECAIIIKGILEAVEFLHQNNIIHRDLKPENIMFKKRDVLESIILCDFGLAYHLDNHILEKLIQGICGTTLYMAPEIIEKRKYDCLVDLFSIGVILYVLASGGKHPIYRKKMTTDEYIKELYALKSNKENFDFPSYMPLLARNLFLKLCKFEPFFRYSTFKALKHPWITRSEKGKIPLTLVDEYEKTDKIKQFKALLTIPMLFETFKHLYHLRIKNKKEDNELILNILNNVHNNNNEHKKVSSSRMPVKNVNFVFQPNNQTKQNYVNYKKNTPNLNKIKTEKKNQDYENESSNETSHISNPSQNKPKIFLKTHSNINSGINHNNVLQNSNSKRKLNQKIKQKRNNTQLREFSNYKTNQITNDRENFDTKVAITPINKSVGKIKINKGSEQVKSSKKINFKTQDNNH